MTSCEASDEDMSEAGATRTSSLFATAGLRCPFEPSALMRRHRSCGIFRSCGMSSLFIAILPKRSSVMWTNGASNDAMSGDALSKLARAIAA